MLEFDINLDPSLLTDILTGFIPIFKTVFHEFSKTAMVSSP